MINKLSLKKLVGNNLKQAFNQLETVLENQKDTIDEFMILKGRFNQVEKDRRQGILTNDEYYKEQNMLRVSCLGLIDELKDETEEKMKQPENIPRLEIELVLRAKTKIPLGVNPKNRVNENEAIEMPNSIYRNKIIFTYKIIIRNNSSVPAYYPELEYPNERFYNVDDINKNKPIKPFEEIELSAEHVLKIETKDKDATEYMDSRYLPDELKQLIILLKYENEQNDSFEHKFQINEGSDPLASLTSR